MSYFPAAYWPTTYFPPNYWPIAQIIPAPLVGARVTRGTFAYKDKFPDLYTYVGAVSSAPLVDEAIAVVEAAWAGTMKLWGIRSVDPAVREANRTLVENLLIGWYLADLYPDMTEDVAGDGGMPLTSKSIGGVSISRKDLEAEPALKQLESNTFGVKALSMIMSAPERFLMYG